jgi:hypothetical protein
LGRMLIFGSLIWEYQRSWDDWNFGIPKKQKLIHSLENSSNAIMRTGFTKSRQTVQSHTLFRELVVLKL